MSGNQPNNENESSGPKKSNPTPEQWEELREEAYRVDREDAFLFYYMEAGRFHEEHRLQLQRRRQLAFAAVLIGIMVLVILYFLLIT